MLRSTGLKSVVVIPGVIMSVRALLPLAPDFPWGQGEQSFSLPAGLLRAPQGEVTQFG